MTSPTLRTPRLVSARGATRTSPRSPRSTPTRVMEFFPRPLDRAESDAMAARIRDDFAARGFGYWAVEVPGVGDFIGFVGLSVPRFEAHFTPCVEIGWRLAADHWGRGYATEAARVALAFGFGISLWMRSCRSPYQRTYDRRPSWRRSA